MSRTLNTVTTLVLVTAYVFLGTVILSAQFAAAKKALKTPACGPRVLVEYTDDDPDYFIIKNRSATGWSLEAIAFDLSPSSGNVVFDPESGGAGVGGAAALVPDETTDIRLVGIVPAQDGGRTLSLRFGNFTDGRNYTFHIDLDSAPSGNGRTWVLPSDMAGTRILATFRGPTGRSDKVDAVFDANAEADTGAGGCV